MKLDLRVTIGNHGVHLKLSYVRARQWSMDFDRTVAATGLKDQTMTVERCDFFLTILVYAWTEAVGHDSRCVKQQVV
jgi:hypothetical protein